MNNKITMLLLSFTLIIGCIISSPITAYAEDPVVTAGKLTGNEDASNLNDFDGNITVQNIFKIWSTLKSLGYTDEQAAGAMGCMKAECHFHAEVVESHCDTGDTEDKYNEYVVFVLGRDLLKGILPLENDIAYEWCVNIAKDFEISEFNVNTKGLYSCLKDYVKARFYLNDDGEISFMGADLYECCGGER